MRKNAKRLLPIAFFLLSVCTFSTSSVASSSPPTTSRAAEDIRKLQLANDTQSQMEAINAGLDGYLYQQDLHKDQNYASEVFEYFMSHADLVWLHIDDALDLTHGMYPLQGPYKAHFENYLRWYSGNAKILMESMDLSLEQSQRLFYEAFGRMHAISNNVIGAGEAIESPRTILNKTYTSVFAVFLKEQAPRLRSQIIELILNGHTKDTPEIKLGLTLTSEIYYQLSNNIQKDSAPMEYRWLIGLGELVMDARAALDPTAVTSTKKPSLDQLFAAYLKLYQQVIDEHALKPSENGIVKNWIKDLVLVPLGHMATHGQHAPNAAQAAHEMLELLKKRTKSKYVLRQVELIPTPPVSFLLRCKILVKSLFAASRDRLKKGA